MGTTKETIEYLLDTLRACETLRARKMFGEYALYYEDKVVGLVCDDQLFVKITPPGRARLGSDYPEGAPYPGAKPAFQIEAELLDDDEALCALIRETAGALPPPKPKGQKATRRGTPKRAVE